MATTITQAKHKVINTDGSIVLFHYQTNADIVVDGTTKKVPSIIDGNNWNAARSEVIAARGSSDLLKTRLNNFDTSLLPLSLLAAIKTVDGSLSGLDADYVDGCGVDDSIADSALFLWTSHKVKTELDKKVNTADVSTTAAANKILKLNANGKLPADVTGNAGTASKLASPISITFSGDIVGSSTFDGSSNITTEMIVADNSHNHSGLTASGPTIINSTVPTGNIIDFKKSGILISSIGLNGDYSGKSATASKLASLRKITLGGDLLGNFDFDGNSDVTAEIEVKNSAKVGSKSVDDTKLTNEYLWTAEKIMSVLGTKLDASTISSLKQPQGKLVVGGITVQWGIVDMSNKTSSIVTFATPYTTAPLIINSDECLDFTWISKRKPSSTTLTQTEFICNKSLATAAKISWVAIGY